MCVQDVDVQCVLQFTLSNAASCALHRRASRVIHRPKLFLWFSVRSLSRPLLSSSGVESATLSGKRARPSGCKGADAEQQPPNFEMLRPVTGRFDSPWRQTPRTPAESQQIAVWWLLYCVRHRV